MKYIHSTKDGQESSDENSVENPVENPVEHSVEHSIESSVENSIEEEKTVSETTTTTHESQPQAEEIPIQQSPLEDKPALPFKFLLKQVDIQTLLISQEMCQMNSCEENKVLLIDYIQ